MVHWIKELYYGGPLVLVGLVVLKALFSAQKHHLFGSFLTKPKILLSLPHEAVQILFWICLLGQGRVGLGIERIKNLIYIDGKGFRAGLDLMKLNIKIYYADILVEGLLVVVAALLILYLCNKLIGDRNPREESLNILFRQLTTVPLLNLYAAWSILLLLGFVSL